MSLYTKISCFLDTALFSASFSGSSVFRMLALSLGIFPLFLFFDGSNGLG